MTRSWLNFVATFIAAAGGIASTCVAAAPNSGPGNGGNRVSNIGRGSSQFNSAQPSNFNRQPLGNLSGAKVNKVGGGGISPITPTFPAGPTKLPKGPIVGPFIPPRGPIGPIKPPKGPIVGP